MKTAISIGNFDAVHLGHLALVQAARDMVGPNGHVEIQTFDPPPVSILDPAVKLDRITTFEERSALLLAAGANRVRKIEPTKSLLCQSPEEFIADVMTESSPDVIVEGEGFCFGKNRVGSNETLRDIGKKLGFSVFELEPVLVILGDATSLRASSSEVRSLLKRGRVEDAALMLGREVRCSGIVTKGDQRGREMGIPTANLSQVMTMLPRDGIYAGSAVVEGELYIAAISVGTKPTFGENERVLEAHLISFDGDLEHYDWPLTVTISHWMREQITFTSIDALRVQIDADIQSTITLIESTR